MTKLEGAWAQHKTFSVSLTWEWRFSLPQPRDWAPLCREQPLWDSFGWRHLFLGSAKDLLPVQCCGLSLAQLGTLGKGSGCVLASGRSSFLHRGRTEGRGSFPKCAFLDKFPPVLLYFFCECPCQPPAGREVQAGELLCSPKVEQGMERPYGAPCWETTAETRRVTGCSSSSVLSPRRDSYLWLIFHRGAAQGQA